MRQHLRLVGLIWLVTVLLGGAMLQFGPGAGAEERRSLAGPLMAPAEAQADFDLMRQALEDAHTGLYRYTSKAELERVFATQRAQLNRPVTKLEFLAVAAEALAHIKCGHTSIAPDSETQATLTNARQLPLRVLMEGRRLMVAANDTADDSTIRPGMEIVEINGHKSGDLLNRLLPSMPSDGDIETGQRALLQGNFARYYWLRIEQAAEFTVKARDAAGKLVTAKLEGVTDADRPKRQNPVNAEAQAGLAKLDWASENLSLRFLQAPEIAQIRIRGFSGSDYPQWIENTFKTLREQGTKVLILDLRGNGGGADLYGAMLVSYLTDKPFRYFDYIRLKTISPALKDHSNWRTEREGSLRAGVTSHPAGGYLVTMKLHPGVGEQAPGKYPFLGQVFVLIDGGTFSTAADFCAVTHHLKRATFIGEETGGGYYGNNSGVQIMVTLPNSKARVRVPMSEYWNAVPGYEGKRRGTRPDHLVEAKVANLLRGVDEHLALALKLANQAGNKKEDKRKN